MESDEKPANHPGPLETDDTHPDQSTESTELSPEGTKAESSKDESQLRPSNDEEEKHDDSNPADEASPAQTELSGVGLLLVTIALQLAMFCISLDGSILATAIPKITNEFDSLEDVAWYGSSYLFTMCAVQLMFGKLYTFYPHKWIFLAGVALFELGSLISAVAPSSVVLIIGRSIAGLGSASLLNGAIIIIAASVPLRKRPIYTALLGSMHAVSGVAGPLLGGAFTDYVTWRLCFYINLPLGAITIVCTFFFLPASKPPPDDSDWKEKIKRLDPIGTVLLIPAVICLLLALQWGGSVYPWNDGRIIALFVLFGVLAIGFFGVQIWQGEHATIPVRLLKDRNVLGGVWYGICIGADLMVFTYYLPIWFQAIKDVSATKSGIMNLPMILGLIGFSLVGGGLATALSYYTPLLIASSIISAIGAGLLSTLEVDSSIGYWLGYQLVLSFGAGLGVQNVMLVPQSAVPAADMAIATSILGFTQTLSGSVFLTVAQSVFQNQLVANVRAELPGVSAESVLAGGATAVRQRVSADQLPRLLSAYNETIVQTFYVAVALAAMSIVGPVFMEWVSLKNPKHGTGSTEASQEQAEEAS